MKYLIFPFLMLLLSLQSGAQKALLDKLNKKVKEKVEQRAEQKINETVDKGMQKVEESIDKKTKKKNKKQENTAGQEPRNGEAKNGQNAAKELDPDVVGEINSTTLPGVVFVKSSYVTNAIQYEEDFADFDSSGAAVLNNVGLALMHELSTNRLRIKVYKKDSKDEQTGDQFTAMKRYLVNRFGLTDDFINVENVTGLKPGKNRTVEFLLLPLN